MRSILTPGGRIFGRIDALDLALDPRDRGRALLAAPHQHDALHDVVGVILPGDAEPWLETDR